MFSRILLTSLLSFLIAAPVSSQTIANKVYNATAILYTQTMSGGMDMKCTATAYKKVDKGYHFISASHCVAKDNTTTERVEVSKVPFYISFDTSNNKVFHPAKVVMAGYGPAGDDFAILQVETDQEWQTIPIGDANDVEMGDRIFNVAAPAGLGRQVFFGSISLLNLDRPVLARGINWNGATLIQLPVDGGSSGSAVISPEQEAIVFFVIGSIRGNPTTVTIPASRFLEFRDAVEAGEYEYFELADENDS